MKKEDIETRAIKAPSNLPRLCRKHVDDNLCHPEKSTQNQFLENINSIDPFIQFTTEKTRQDGSLTLLDFLFIPEPDRTLSIAVYTKPTHTDFSLHWNSNHSQAAEYSVFNNKEDNIYMVVS